MKFDITNYKGEKVVVHCKTLNEAVEFCSLTNQTYKIDWWFDYKEETCYDLNRKEYSNIKFYLEHNYTILEWESLNTNKFTKSDLKNGDVVLRRDGSVQIVCLETGTLIDKDSFSRLFDLAEDLTSIGDFGSKDYDIMEVRRPQKAGDCVFYAFDRKLGELVYKRKEEEEIERETAETALKEIYEKLEILKKFYKKTHTGM